MASGIGWWTNIAERRNAPDSGEFMDALGFCEFLESRLSELGSRYEYFVDAFRYEKDS